MNSVTCWSIQHDANPRSSPQRKTRSEGRQSGAIRVARRRRGAGAPGGRRRDGAAAGRRVAASGAGLAAPTAARGGRWTGGPRVTPCATPPPPSPLAARVGGLLGGEAPSVGLMTVKGEEISTE